MARLPIGQRIRDNRKDCGLTQSALAKAVGISPSYLNLIEHDRRSIGGVLLKRIAETLGVPLERLSGSEDARIAQDILELARSLAIPGLDERSAAWLVARHPEWAIAFRALHRRYQDVSEAALALSERLGEFAEILGDMPEIDTHERDGYAGLIGSHGERLSASARAMIALLHGDPDAPRLNSPRSEVDDFVLQRDSYFPELEEAADRLRRRIESGNRTIAAAVSDYLTGRLGVGIRFREDGGAAGSTHVLVLDAWMPETTHRFQKARRVVEMELSEQLDAMVLSERLVSGEARRIARRTMANYAASALLFPYERFLEAAEALRYDIDGLRSRFSGSFEQIAHRFVTLRRPGAEGVPFAFLRADPAGNISKPFSAGALRMPRVGSGGACPLWAVYAAFSAPDQTVTQLVEMPSGERFLFIARRVIKRAPAAGAAGSVFGIMIGCDAEYAPRIVNGDTLGTVALPVGFNCRSCPRSGCAQRAHGTVLLAKAGRKPAAASS